MFTWVRRISEGPLSPFLYRALVHVAEGVDTEEPSSAFLLGLQLERYFPTVTPLRTSKSWAVVLTNGETLWAQVRDADV